jgi:hypothetical protein
MERDIEYKKCCLPQDEAVRGAAHRHKKAADEKTAEHTRELGVTGLRWRLQAADRTNLSG